MTHTQYLWYSLATGNSKWDWYVEYKGMSWSLMIHTWLAQNQVPVHVLQYERLSTDLRGELVKTLKFLDYHVSNETIDCVLENSMGQFKRTHHLNFDPFTNENREAMNRYLRLASPLLAKHGIKYNTRHL